MTKEADSKQSASDDKTGERRRRRRKGGGLRIPSDNVPRKSQPILAESGEVNAPVPENPAELPEWAAYLVVETLDELDLVLA